MGFNSFKKLKPEDPWASGAPDADLVVWLCWVLGMLAGVAVEPVPAVQPLGRAVNPKAACRADRLVLRAIISRLRGRLRAQIETSWFASAPLLQFKGRLWTRLGKWKLLRCLSCLLNTYKG